MNPFPLAQWRNITRAGLAALRAAPRRGMFGDYIRLDASSICQLRCPLCDTGGGRQDAIGSGLLRLEHFLQIVDDNPWIRRVELSNWGEIFLNPELPRILAAGHARGIALSAGNGANLNTVSEEALEALVKYRFRFLCVSIDGVSDETYSAYRRRGDLEQVLANLRAINRHKERLGSPYPRLCWQFIPFGHNQHELPAARRLAAELGMDFITRDNWDPSFSPLEPGPGGGGAGGARVEMVLPCFQLWLSPQINWDGRLLGCCINTEADFGDVLASGLSGCLQGERYRRAKEMLLGFRGEQDDVPCTRCGVYRTHVKPGGHRLRLFARQVPNLIRRYRAKQ